MINKEDYLRSFGGLIVGFKPAESLLVCFFIAKAASWAGLSTTVIYPMLPSQPTAFKGLLPFIMAPPKRKFSKYLLIS